MTREALTAEQRLTVTREAALAYHAEMAAVHAAKADYHRRRIALLERAASQGQVTREVLIPQFSFAEASR